jgi:hypothetical protein
MAPDVAKKVGPLEKSISEIVWRLKKFKYPYELGAKKSKTFYLYMKSREILDLVTTANPVLWEIRRFWTFGFYDSYFKELGDYSPKGFPLSFHRDLLQEFSQHLAKVEELAERYKVKPEAVMPHRSAVLARLLDEAAIYYPEIPRDYTPANRLSTPARKIEAQFNLFNTLRAAFLKKRFDSRKFTYQLTALLATTTEHIKHNNELSPNPDTVRRNVRSLGKMLEKRGGGFKVQKSV